MAKLLYGNNGKWLDRNNKNAVFKGKVIQDLNVGDKVERERDGKISLVEVTEKKQSAKGNLVVIMHGTSTV